MLDQQEFTEILHFHLPGLNRFVSGMVGNRFEADDIVQETAVKALLHFRDLREDAKFKTWLMTIAVNEVRSKRRMESRSRLAYLDFDDLERLGAVAKDSPYCRFEARQQRRALRTAIASLDPRCKEMIQLRAIEGLSLADAAQRLSVPVSLVKSRYHRAVTETDSPRSPKSPKSE
jgi:RNA polymerase sigma-70 factor, ECF subfamily